MTKQEIYDQVVNLTSELAHTDIAIKIFDTANNGSAEDVENAVLEFQTENPELHQKIVDFGQKCINMMNEGMDVEIFGVVEDTVRGLYVFDPILIDALSFELLTFLIEVDDSQFFSEWEDDVQPLLDSIVESDYDELANFLELEQISKFVGSGGSYSNWYEFLVDLFAEEIEY